MQIVQRDTSFNQLSPIKRVDSFLWEKYFQGKKDKKNPFAQKLIIRFSFRNMF